MFNYFLYFTGILIGIFIILIIISDKGDLKKLFKSYKEYFNNDNVNKYEKPNIQTILNTLYCVYFIIDYKFYQFNNQSSCNK